MSKRIAKLKGSESYKKMIGDWSKKYSLPIEVAEAINYAFNDITLPLNDLMSERLKNGGSLGDWFRLVQDFTEGEMVELKDIVGIDSETPQANPMVQLAKDFLAAKRTPAEVLTALASNMSLTEAQTILNQAVEA